MLHLQGLKRLILKFLYIDKVFYHFPFEDYQTRCLGAMLFIIGAEIPKVFDYFYI
jgi:hypothetical protein